MQPVTTVAMVESLSHKGYIFNAFAIFLNIWQVKLRQITSISNLESYSDALAQLAYIPNPSSLLLLLSVLG